MTKFISVLNSDLALPYWKAIQWGYSLEQVEKNKYYIAGVNLNFPKSEGDTKIKSKEVEEVNTGQNGTATIIELDKQSTNVLRLANNKATKTFLKQFGK